MAQIIVKEERLVVGRNTRESELTVETVRDSKHVPYDEAGEIFRSLKAAAENMEGYEPFRISNGCVKGFDYYVEKSVDGSFVRRKVVCYFARF